MEKKNPKILKKKGNSNKSEKLRIKPLHTIIHKILKNTQKVLIGLQKSNTFKKITHKTHHFTLAFDLRKHTQPTAPPTHIKKINTLFIQSQDTSIPITPHKYPQDI